MKKRHREAVQDVQFQNKAHNLLFVKEQNEREWEVNVIYHGYVQHL